MTVVSWQRQPKASFVLSMSETCVRLWHGVGSQGPGPQGGFRGLPPAEKQALRGNGLREAGVVQVPAADQAKQHQFPLL